MKELMKRSLNYVLWFFGKWWDTDLITITIFAQKILFTNHKAKYMVSLNFELSLKLWINIVELKTFGKYIVVNVKTNR